MNSVKIVSDYSLERYPKSNYGSQKDSDYTEGNACNTA